jgi:hypothetical protein
VRPGTRPIATASPELDRAAAKLAPEIRQAVPNSATRASIPRAASIARGAYPSNRERRIERGDQAVADMFTMTPPRASLIFVAAPKKLFMEPDHFRGRQRLGHPRERFDIGEDDVGLVLLRCELAGVDQLLGEPAKASDASPTVVLAIIRPAILMLREK